MKNVVSVVLIVAAIAFAMWLGYRDGHEHRATPANEAAAKQ